MIMANHNATFHFSFNVFLKYFSIQHLHLNFLEK